MKNLLRKILAAQTVAAVLTTAATAADVAIYFSPNGGAAAAVITRIDAAKTSLFIMAYSISHEGITNAIIRAKTRGLTVILIVDPGQRTARYSTADRIRRNAVLVFVDRNETLMHNKTIIIDEHTVVTGSMNLTAAGNEKNAENVIIVDDPAAARTYGADFQKHLKHSTAFQPQPALSLPQPAPTQ